MFEDDDNGMNDLASTMVSFSKSNWEANINANFSAALAAPPSVDQHLSPSSDVACCHAMSLRGENASLVRPLEVAKSRLNLS